MECSECLAALQPSSQAANIKSTLHFSTVSLWSAVSASLHCSRLFRLQILSPRALLAASPLCIDTVNALHNAVPNAAVKYHKKRNS